MKTKYLNYKLNCLIFTISAFTFEACTSKLYCDGDEKCDQLTVKLAKDSYIDPEYGGCIYGKVENYSTFSLQTLSIQSQADPSKVLLNIEPERVWFAESKNSTTTCPMLSPEIATDMGVRNSSNFIIDARNMKFADAGMPLPNNADVNLYYLEANDSGVDGNKREVIAPLKSRKSPISRTAIIANGISSSIERLGFSGSELLSLRSYTELMNVKKKFAQYSTSASAISTDSAPQGFAFSKEFTGAQVNADFAASRVVWLDVISNIGLSLVNCPTNAMMASDCSNPSSTGYPNNLLPLDIKAFAISPMAEFAVISESSGALRFASLPSQTSSPPPLAWAPLTNQPAPSRKDKVLLALGDLDGNPPWDLLVLHQDAQQQDVSVFLGQTSGGPLAYDKTLSDSWQASLGTMPISAVALGDLDSDGRADVAISRGSQVTVWLNQMGGQPLNAWSAEVQKDVPVRALAIGQVDRSGPNDLVVASSTSDSMGNVMQYLHAYLGQ